jgi:hypothetical protein
MSSRQGRRRGVLRGLLVRLQRRVLIAAAGTTGNLAVKRLVTNFDADYTIQRMAVWTNE